MNLKKIAAFAAAAVMAAGICTGVPAGTENDPLLAVTASANTVTGKQSYELLPANYSAVGGDKEITVKWDAVSGAKSYSVLYCKTGANHYTQAGTTSSTSYTIKNLTNGIGYDILIVPDNADNACVGLKNVIPEAPKAEFVIKINDDGDKYLAEYNGKGGNVVIPKEVKIVASEVFAGNEDITSVTFPKNFIYAAGYSFAECTNLKKVVFEGNAMIGMNAFEWCVNLESVTVKGSIDTGIFANAFYGCESLKTVKISGNKKSFAIGGNAFRDCYSLTSINIPDKCTEIYGKAFLNCFSLTKLTIPAKTKINTSDNDDCHFGYAYLYKTKADAGKIAEGGSAEGKKFVANGKTNGYAIYYKVSDELRKNYGGWEMVGYYSGDIGLYYDKSYELVNCKKYTPKQLTLTVTKGSPAEKWAKENKVKYVYAKTTKKSTTTKK